MSVTGCDCGFLVGLGDICVCGTDYDKERRESLANAIALKLTSSAIVAEFIAGKSITEVAECWHIKPSSVEQVLRRDIISLLRQV